MIRTVNVVGLGALGMLFGGIIAKNIGSIEGGSIHFVMDPDRYLRHRDDRYTVNGEAVGYSLQSSSDAEPADLVIVAVKYNALKDALDTMASSVDGHTIILSVMNGINSEKIIAERFPENRIVDCIAMGMDAMRSGTDLVYTVTGNLHLGTRYRENEQMQKTCREVEEFFSKVRLPYIHEEDIMYRMWFKFMLNVGINQTCMVYGVGYGKALEEGTEECMAFAGAMREVIDLSGKEGVKLTCEDMNKAVAVLRTLDPEAVPSMAQDRLARRKSEADMFAGVVIELGKKYGIMTPANSWMYKRVHEIEEAYNEAAYNSEQTGNAS